MHSHPHVRTLVLGTAIVACAVAGCTTSVKPGGHPSPVSAAAAPSTQITPLEQTLLPDPPYGAGYQTSGSYPQLSGAPGLDAVNSALRALITGDQQRARDGFKSYGPPAPGSGPGVYSSDPGLGRSSVGSAVVSYLIATTAIYPGGNDGDGWVSATLLVPSAREVSISSLFDDPVKGLTAISTIAKDDIVATNSCLGQNVAEGDAADALAPTEDNYSRFAMTPAGLSIGFEQGQLGGEACGRQVVTVGWDRIRPLLSAEGNKLVGELR